MFLYYMLLVFIFFLAANCHNGLGDSIKRNDFPEGFVFGTASSAYQYEGAISEDGKGPSIWDTLTKNHPEMIRDHSSGANATDSYHRYKEDVSLMKSLGFDAYRFSISWSRLLPRGRLSGGVNQAGIRYYNNLINELLSNGIKPFVTLFHSDVPQALEDEYGGFLNPKIVKDYQDFAKLCFSKFGDRVKHWITLNEPQSFAMGSLSGMFKATRRCSKWVSSSCTGGDPSTEPYLLGHYQILAHAAAVKAYRNNYQTSQKGRIGITLNSLWFIPSTNTSQDRSAASRALAFQYDWFMDPLKFGKYPDVMVTRLGKRLPQFTKEQSSIVEGSFDFIGVNYYTSYYAADVPCPTQNLSYSTDSCANQTFERKGVPIGPKAGSSWLYVYPRGIKKLLLYTKKKYNDPVMYITENGYSENNTNSIVLSDNIRESYYRSHLSFVLEAIRKGVNVKGFFAWSLLDNFEWFDGYTIRFGIVFVNYNDGLKRYPKKSALWFNDFFIGNNTKD